MNGEGWTNDVSNPINKAEEGGGGYRQNGKFNRALCGRQMSTLMIFSFIVMITGFTCATPISLILTIPAYALADRVSW